MIFEDWLDSYLLDSQYADTAPKTLMAAMAYNAAVVAQREPMPCGHPRACVVVGERHGGEYEHHCGWCASLDAERDRWVEAIEKRWPHLAGVVVELVIETNDG